MAETSVEQKPAQKSVGFVNQSQSGEGDPKDDLDLEMKMRDEKLYNSIADILKQEGHKRVLLTGEAGIGKTRLAKVVEKHVTDTEKCFLTIWLHLNRTFKDEFALYENIASQLCVYSDFEETEVDDRDEDEEEEKKLEVPELRKKIIDEIVNRRKEFEAKESQKRKKEDEKRKKDAENKKKDATKKKEKTEVEQKTTPTAEDNKKDTSSSTKPYLLLVLDDEGKTSEKKVMKDFKLWEFLLEVVNHVDKEMKELKKSEGNGDPNTQKVPVDPSSHKTPEDPTTLKILVTRDGKPISEASGEIESQDEKSEAGAKSDNGSEESNEERKTDRSEGQEGAKSDNGSEELNEERKTDISEGQEGANNENGSEGQEGANVESEIVSVGATESQEKDNKEKTKDQGAENVQDTVRDGENAPATKDASLAYDDLINSQTTNVSQGLRDLINTTFLENLFKDVITKDYVGTFEDDISDIVKQSKNSPAAIVVLAKSLKSIMLSKKLSDAELKEKIKRVLSADRSEASGSGSPSEASGSGSPSKASGSGSPKERAVNPIMHLAYELLETYDPPKRVSEPSGTPDPPKHPILDCFWHTLDFFEHCGCVYYRDLITQWMLEGYFDPVRSVEEAYQQGHSILMELINRGMLKIQENNVVVPEMAMINLIDPRRHGHLGSSRLGFSRVYRGDKDRGIGKITQIDEMIKTVQAKKGDKITTLLVSGDRVRRVTPTKYFKKLDHLEVIGLFEPTLEPFISPLSKLLELRVLVIRDCDLLNSIEELKALHKLNALEVSGASSLDKISDDFFKAFPKLQSLHLSGLQITSSPSSISLLKELHCLIIKNCPLLEDLPNIQGLEELEVIDISGALSLQTCFDNAKGDKKKDKSKNKNFYHLQKLQLLDFSESQIERLPLFQDAAVNTKLKSLTRLLLRNCRNLRRLPSLKPLTDLEILDLSGTTSLVEMLEVCFEDKSELKTLNLSRTNLNELATTIEGLSGLKEFLLRDCLNLDAIPNIEKLTNLEVLDVSGSTKLEKIEGSFKDMSYLREVNLFGTKVEMPELPKESNIHCLKRITLRDGKCFEGDDWSIITKNIKDRSLNASPSDVKSEEIEEIRDTRPAASHASDATEKRGLSKERLLQLAKESSLYMNILSRFDDPNCQQKVLEINETNKLDENELANAESVSFVDCTPTRLTSIFKKTTSVKCCWLTMCTDIKELFSEVDKEGLKSLETLSIRHLPLLETISSVDNLENLKNLTLECCPKIITIFPKKPTGLEVLNTKHCENLEKVVEGVELSTLNLTCNSQDCPKFEGSPPALDPIDSDYVFVEHGDAPTQSPPPHE